jgi:GGDEF domain-containing protein
LATPYQLTVSQPGTPERLIQHHCSASIGVVVFVSHQDSQADILKWGDMAMYQAKAAGRNAIRFFEALPSLTSP